MVERKGTKQRDVCPLASSSTRKKQEPIKQASRTQFAAPALRVCLFTEPITPVDQSGCWQVKQRPCCSKHDSAMKHSVPFPQAHFGYYGVTAPQMLETRNRGSTSPGTWSKAWSQSRFRFLAYPSPPLLLCVSADAIPLTAWPHLWSAVYLFIF